jgi:hypothetical protein
MRAGGLMNDDNCRVPPGIYSDKMLMKRNADSAEWIDGFIELGAEKSLRSVSAKC